MALRRSDFIDDSVDKLFTWSSGINVGVLTIAFTRLGVTNLNDWRLVIASVLYVTMIVLVFTVKLAGWLKVINPRTLWSEWLHKSHWQFQKGIIDWGSQHFVSNMTLVKKKAKLAGYASFSFLLEMVVLVWWVLSSLHQH